MIGRAKRQPRRTSERDAPRPGEDVQAEELSSVATRTNGVVAASITARVFFGGDSGFKRGLHVVRVVAGGHKSHEEFFELHLVAAHDYGPDLFLESGLHPTTVCVFRPG